MKRITELGKTRLILLRMFLSKSYPNDYNLLTTGQSLSGTSLILTLTPIVKNDLLCVGGRINRPDLPNSNNQIIICKSHPIAKLLVIKNVTKRIFTSIENTH